MKKIVTVLLMVLALVGCTSKEVSKTFYYEQEADGYKFTHTETYKAIRDEITHGEIVSTITIDEPMEGELEFYEAILEEQKACPYGVLDGSDKMIGCSKYITVDWTFDETTNTFKSTEELRFKDAATAKEDIYTEEAGGSYKENEYYSLEKFEEDLLAEGYTLVK